MTDALGGRTDPLVGTVLDKDYLTIRRIGIGGMSVVYLVEHQRLNKQFAAKLLNAELAANSEALSRFETEAKSASSLEHENIVRVTDYGVAVDGRPYIIMELLKGSTLDEYLVEHPLSLEESVLLIVSVCRGLAAAHAETIVHRDIKPDNIYLTTQASGSFGVKLLDFGIAKAPLRTGRVTKDGTTIGTPHYMAPEACRGEEVDNRADIYSVGVLMYLLFTGQLPHHDDNFLALLQKQVTEIVTPPRQINPEITPALEEVILHAIAKDPDDRYLSIEHLLSEFELALPAGANTLLMRAARVSTPIPLITPTTLPAMKTPLPRPRPSQALPVVEPVTSLPVAPPATEPKRSRAPLVGLLALLVVGGGVFALTRHGHESEPAAKLEQPANSTTQKLAEKGGAPTVVEQAPPASKVKLKISTRPQHALIKLDGIELGRTPLDLDLAPVNNASLVIVAEGYDTQSQSLSLVTDQTLDITLARKRDVAPPPHERPKPPNPKPPKPGPSVPPDSDLEIRMHR